MKKTCDDCGFSCWGDYGYSNLTTEGSELYCLKGLNSDLPLEPAQMDPALDYAQKCSFFTPGESAWVSTDRDYIDTGDSGMSSEEIIKIILQQET